MRDVLDRLAELRLLGRDSTAVLLLALTNWLVDAGCLAAALACVGAPVPWQGLLLAFLAGAGATSLGLTPGGLGVVELTLTAGLVAAGLDGLHALAEVLLSRLVSLWLATAAGWAALASLTAGGASRPSQQPVVPASRPAVAVSARP